MFPLKNIETGKEVLFTTEEGALNTLKSFPKKYALTNGVIKETPKIEPVIEPVEEANIEEIEEPEIE
jgi:hypothetical protein